MFQGLLQIHLQKINIHLCPNLFHYGQYMIVNQKGTWMFKDGLQTTNLKNLGLTFQDA